MRLCFTTLVLFTVMSLALPSGARGQGKQDPLVRLSNSRDMVQRTKKVNHCGARQAREIRARRNAFMKSRNLQYFRPDSIAIIETRSFFNNEVYYHAYCNDSSGTPGLLCNAAKVSVLIPFPLSYKEYYKVYLQNLEYFSSSMEMKSETNDYFPELVRRAFATRGDTSSLKQLFEPSSLPDSSKIYYLWLVVRDGNRYRTLCYNSFEGYFKLGAE